MSNALTLTPTPGPQAAAPSPAPAPDVGNRDPASDAFAQALERAARADAPAAPRQRLAAQGERRSDAAQQRAALAPTRGEPASAFAATDVVALAASAAMPQEAGVDAALPAATDIGALLAQLQTLLRDPAVAGNGGGRLDAGLAKPTAAQRGSAAAETVLTDLPGPTTTGAAAAVAGAAAASALGVAPPGEDLLRAATPALEAAPRVEAPALLATAVAAPVGTGFTGAPAVAEARLAATPGSADFGSQFGAQLTTFVRAGVEHARLHLNPAEMGPVSVQIRLDGQTAVVHLSTDNPLTRQALEQAMPQLASSLREAGLTLTGGGVFDQRGPGGQPGADSPGTARRTAPDGEEAGAAALVGAAPAQRRGVVDLVA